MDSLTNMEIFELFKNHKTRFQTKPNFDVVADEVIHKLELTKSSKSKVKEDLEELFKEYKIIRKHNRTIHSNHRKLDEKIAIIKSSYSKFGSKVPLDDATPRTQRRLLQSFNITTTDIADEQGLTPPKILAFRLKSQ